MQLLILGMMKIYTSLVGAVLAVSSTSYATFSAQDEALVVQADTALQQKDYTKAVKILKEALAHSQDPGPLLARLSIAYARSQETERALQTFLQALSLPPNIQIKEDTDPQDALLLGEVLKKNCSGLPPSEIARDTLKTYLPVHKEHPRYFLLNFALALAYANLNQYGEFFNRFYDSYQCAPHHFLVDKTRGILHVKLSERGNISEERQRHRASAIEAFSKAIDKNPSDGHLYLLLIGLTRGQEAYADMTVMTLKRLIEEDVLIPRRDIVPYVHEAIQCGRKDLAKQIVEQAKAHYPYSRAVDAAEMYLQQKSEQAAEAES